MEMSSKLPQNEKKGKEITHGDNRNGEQNYIYVFDTQFLRNGESHQSISLLYFQELRPYNTAK